MQIEKLDGNFSILNFFGGKSSGLLRVSTPSNPRFTGSPFRLGNSIALYHFSPTNDLIQMKGEGDRSYKLYTMFAL